MPKKTKPTPPRDAGSLPLTHLMAALGIAIALGFLTSLIADTVSKLIAHLTRNSSLWLNILVQLVVVAVVIVAIVLILEFGVRRPLGL